MLLFQLVSLLRDGKPYKMGKRLGNLVTIEEVVEEIDAAAGRKGRRAPTRSDTSIWSRRSEVADRARHRDREEEQPRQPGLLSAVRLRARSSRSCGARRTCSASTCRAIRRPRRAARRTPTSSPFSAQLGTFPRVVREAAAERGRIGFCSSSKNSRSRSKAITPD